MHVYHHKINMYDSTCVYSCDCSAGCIISTTFLMYTITEPSLTSHNLTIVLVTLPDKEWYDFGWKIGVPQSKRDYIRSQYSSDEERKSALLHTYLTSHPAPSWQHITLALYRCGHGKHHTVLERVQRMFPTGDGYAHSFKYTCTCMIVHAQFIHLYCV